MAKNPAISARNTGPTPVEAIKHKDSRINIPTELHSTVSRPFAPPETGKIAVKVINHYGDEVLKVYDVVGVPA